MDTASDTPCSACEQGSVSRRSVGGRRVAYLQIPDLELPASLHLSVCDGCDEIFIDSDQDAAAYDAAVEQAHALAVSAAAQVALAELVAAGVRQRDLEGLLGISGGYLSKIKSGKDVSTPLASLLLLLAAEPARVQELKRSWGPGSEQIHGSASFQIQTTEGANVLYLQPRMKQMHQAGTLTATLTATP